MVPFFEKTWMFWWAIAFVAILRFSLPLSIDETESDPHRPFPCDEQPMDTCTESQSTSTEAAIAR
jgi:hypothetical protein